MNQMKNLSEILEDGKRWQHELSIVLIEICKRLEVVENLVLDKALSK